MAKAVQCKECNKFFEDGLSICPFCGTAVSVDKSESVSKSEPVFKDECGEKTKTVLSTDIRKSLLFFFERTPVFNILLNFSIVMTMIYPTWMFMAAFDSLQSFVNIFTDFALIMLIIFIFGAVLCFAKKQSSVLTVAFALMTIYAYVSADGYFSTNVTIIVLFLCAMTVACLITAIKDRRNGDDTTSVAWLISIVVLLVGSILFINLISGRKCYTCGERIEGKVYQAVGNNYCKDCYINDWNVDLDDIEVNW